MVLSSTDSNSSARVAIIGAGPGGISLGYYLLQAGFRNFQIFERSDGVGGVWRDNDYPGCGCDVESYLYSFSFELNKDWSRTFARQPEILDYLKRCVERHNLAPHLRMNTEIVAAHWDERASQWTIRSRDGQEFQADILVSAIGIFSKPKYPQLDGFSKFKGIHFHSSGWNHDFDPRGKAIAVVGTGASAIQFVPQLANLARNLYVFQRQPGWVVPKDDVEYTGFERWVLKNVPLAARLLKLRLWITRELNTHPFPTGKRYARQLARVERFFDDSVTDARLRESLHPDYPVGCKRMLRSNEWYPTLAKPHVELVSGGVRDISESAVIASDGRRFEVDAIVFGTGFEPTNYLAELDIRGRKGIGLHDYWKSRGTVAYLGMTVPNFPNFFIMYGPNTNAGNSIFYILEQQSKYIVRAMKFLKRKGMKSLDVKTETLDRFDDEVQQASQGSVWLGGCTNYLLDEKGKVRTQWPYRAWYYALLTRRFKKNEYNFTKS